MFRPAHFQRSAELLDRVLAGHTPADRVMEQYFRAHREMGSRDRGYVAETVYGCLRHKRALEYACGHAGDARDLVVAYLSLHGGIGADDLIRFDRRADTARLIERVRVRDPAAAPPAVRANVPDWLWERLAQQLGAEEALQLAAALNQPAPVDLRVNTVKTTREQLCDELVHAGYPSEPTPYSPLGLRRRDRKPLFGTAAFQEGRFELQDEGSQLLSLLVEARPGDRVADFCAGGGGKTLHLGALMQNKGTLYAFDVHAKRLDALKPRLRRAGLDNVRVQLLNSERDPHVKRLRGTIDRVLVDAPCSGTGTLRRNPDLKWRDVDLAAIVARQRAILDAAATLVKPGGRLVYATCSLLREENEDVVDAFLAGHAEYARAPVNDVLARAGVPLMMSAPDLRLFPHRHGTDGFYAAVLGRRGASN
jgi:16S rRNA (cytosine967-C5)-methyltransferase